MKDLEKAIQIITNVINKNSTSENDKKELKEIVDKSKTKS